MYCYMKLYLVKIQTQILEISYCFNYSMTSELLLHLDKLLKVLCFARAGHKCRNSELSSYKPWMGRHTEMYLFLSMLGWRLGQEED